MVFDSNASALNVMNAAFGARRRAARTLWAWWAIGLAAFVLLPWYFPQNLSLWGSLPGVFGGAETGGGLVQAWRHGRPAAAWTMSA